ncbi:MAG: DNA-binding NarL/FixJ family response regulator [Cellvibrionaceae bacterium]|jgi:DNA-binding NarL/FixJ family response regulator
MTHTTKVIIVDDQRLMRDGLRLLLELEDGIEVVGEAADGKKGVAKFHEHSPDIVLMDIRMPNMNGIQATKEILNTHPKARIIILTTFDDDDLIMQGIQAGALGYMLKDLSGEELAAAIQTVMAGGSQLDARVTRKLLGQITNPTPKPRTAESDLLTDREIEILSLVAKGFSNPEISRKLHLAEGTVKNYVSGIIQKLDVRDRVQAAVQAREMGII